jgi:hypothetical protein
MANPDEMLTDARQATREWESAEPGSRAESEAAERATAAWSALDTWMSTGGWPPIDWPPPGLPTSKELARALIQAGVTFHEKQAENWASELRDALLKPHRG